MQRTEPADGSLLVLSGLDHSQSSAQDTEHHAGEEAGHVHTKAPAHISRGLASPEVAQVAQTDGVEPEHVVQSVVQTGGDEQTVQEGVDAGADAVHASDAVADCDQSVEDDGPDEQQNNGHQNGDQTGSDCNEALAGEECQPVRQLDILELVVAGSAHNSGQNADEGVAGDLLEGDVGSSAFFQVTDHADHTGVQQLLHHQEADQTGQTCGAVVVCKADSGTNGKQPCHVIDQSAACLDQQEANGVSCTGGCSTGNAHNARSKA